MAFGFRVSAFGFRGLGFRVWGFSSAPRVSLEKGLAGFAVGLRVKSRPGVLVSGLEAIPELRARNWVLLLLGRSRGRA